MKTFIHHDVGELVRTTHANGKRVYITPDGNTYPSVTSVTSLHGKEITKAWKERVGEEEATRVSRRATQRGTAVHALCEEYLKTGSASPSMFDVEVFNSFKPYLDKIDNIHALETQLYSDHLQVAGGVDCIAEYEGKLYLIDFKTGKKKEKDKIHNYFMQCAAYAVAFEERTGIPVHRILIILATDDDGVILFEERRDNWVKGFIELRKEYRQLYGV